MRVLVAMSGGVDSSVAAAVLLEQGHDVVGVTMKLWGGASDSGCCSVADVDALPLLDPSHLDFLTTAVGSLVRELGPTPLIGFAGAPFTLATYLIEGGPSKEHARTKAFMHAEPAAWQRLLERLAVSAATFLRVQVDAGAAEAAARASGAEPDQVDVVLRGVCGACRRR